MKKIYLDWDWFEKRIKEIAKQLKPIKHKFRYIYGVPRGGLVPAVKLSHYLELPLTFNPNKDSIIIDDCIDSGKTKEKFKDFFFIVLIDKQKENIKDWLLFPWEVDKDEIQNI